MIAAPGRNSERISVPVGDRQVARPQLDQLGAERLQRRGVEVGEPRHRPRLDDAEPPCGQAQRQPLRATETITT